MRWRAGWKLARPIVALDLRLVDLVLDNGVDAVAALDADLRVASWNEPMAELSRLSAADASGAHLFTLFPQARTPRVEKALAGALRGELAVEGAPFFGASDPSLAGATDWRAVPLWEAGRVAGVALVARTRALLDERTGDSETRFRLMADSSPVLLWLSGIDGKCTFFNSTWLEFTGRTLEQEHGEGWAEGVHPEDFERLMTEYMAAFSARRPFEVEYRLRRRDGAYRWILDRGAPRFAASGVFSGFIGSCTDITDRYAAELESQRLARELEEANDHMERLLYAASHDVREPLRNVRTFLDQIERSFSARASDREREYIHHAVDGAERMRELLDGLLDFAEVRKKTLELREVDMNHLMRSVLSGLAREVADQNARVEVGELPEVTGDPVLLVALFRSLVANSLKFRGASPLRVTIVVEPSAYDHVIKVSDNGIGFDQAYAQSLFSMFNRLERRDLYPGPGIGLAIAKEVVDRHRGRLWARGFPGEGASFHVALPRKQTSRGAREAGG
jgi:PAS domain S-box-containing protein